MAPLQLDRLMRRPPFWAAGGFVLVGVLLAMTGRAAPVPSVPASASIPVMADPNAPSPTATTQPVGVQALDAAHFVVVTREPRLVTRAGGDGRYVNMILYVVTYYTVQNGRLTPIEHVHVPEGWRAFGTGE